MRLRMGRWRIFEQLDGLLEAEERFRLPTRPEQLPEQHDRLGRVLALSPSKKRVPRFGEHIVTGRLGVESALAEAEKELGALGIDSGPELEGGLVETHRAREGVEARRSVASLPKRNPGSLGQRRRVLARCSCELERAQV